MQQSVIDAMSGVANACQAAPNIVTGGQPTEAQLKALKAAGGAIVLDIREPMEPRPVNEASVAQREGLEYVNVPVSSSRLSDETLERILAVLRGAGEKQIFFHCGSGNRVGGAMLAYLMIDRGLPEEEAVTDAMRMGLRSAEYLEWGLDYARRHSAS